MASVFLGDLDDFIAPGQACINPLFTPAAAPVPVAAPETSGSKSGAAMVLELEDDGGPLDAMVRACQLLDSSSYGVEGLEIACFPFPMSWRFSGGGVVNVCSNTASTTPVVLDCCSAKKMR